MQASQTASSVQVIEQVQNVRLTRRTLLLGASATALLTACGQVPTGQSEPGNGQAWNDDTFWDDGSGWV